MSPSRIFGTMLRLLLLLTASIPVVLLLLVVQSQPSVPPSLPLTAVELTEVERLLLDSAPAATARASQQELRLSHGELNLLLRYGLQVMDLTPDWAGELAALTGGNLSLDISMALASGRLPLYLNVQGKFANGSELPVLNALQVGNLALPKSLQHLALSRLGNHLLASKVDLRDFAELARNIERIRIEQDSLHLILLWEPHLIERIASRSRQLFVPAAERQRIIVYYRKIGEIVATIPSDLAAVSLNSLLVPLFHHAHEVSVEGNDPVVENRAALQALAVYVNNEDLRQLLGPVAAGIEPVPFIEVRLLRRQDLAQHLTSVAATTAAAGAGFAELLSTIKEAYDARYRSGFSFSDFTANSVGVILASFATRDRQSALTMQSRLSAVDREEDYMPVVGSNSDGLSEADFATIYRDRNSPEYGQRVAEIQALILAGPLFQGLE